MVSEVKMTKRPSALVITSSVTLKEAWLGESYVHVLLTCYSPVLLKTMGLRKFIPRSLIIQ